jgi:hypothetical protein
MVLRLQQEAAQASTWMKFKKVGKAHTFDKHTIKESPLNPSSFDTSNSRSGTMGSDEANDILVAEKTFLFLALALTVPAHLLRQKT